MVLTNEQHAAADRLRALGAATASSLIARAGL
jgi:hypothetical protein